MNTPYPWAIALLASLLGATAGGATPTPQTPGTEVEERQERRSSASEQAGRASRSASASFSSALAESLRARRHGGRRSRPLTAGEKIPLSTRNADLAEVLRAFAILADVNLVLDPKVQGQVTVELHDVAWEEALAVVLRTQGLAAELDGRIWNVRLP